MIEIGRFFGMKFVEDIFCKDNWIFFWKVINCILVLLFVIVKFIILWWEIFDICIEKRIKNCND